MRDYGKISPKFWIGKTGKELRKHPEAQIVAMYLMTCPTSEMTGVFQCPLMYIAHETGLGNEGAYKGLQRLFELDFCTFDEDSETFFVHEMAKWQIGEELKVNDNQVKWVKKAYLSMSGEIKAKFYDRYKTAFHLGEESPLQAPTKPGTEAGTGTGTESKQEQKEKKARATRLPSDWQPNESEIDYCRTERPDLNPQRVAENFRDYWHGSGKPKADWSATWRTWVRNEKPPARASPGYKSAADKSKEIADALTGRTSNEPRIIDIN